MFIFIWLHWIVETKGENLIQIIRCSSIYYDWLQLPEERVLFFMLLCSSCVFLIIVGWAWMQVISVFGRQYCCFGVSTIQIWTVLICLLDFKAGTNQLHSTTSRYTAVFYVSVHSHMAPGSILTPLCIWDESAHLVACSKAYLLGFPRLSRVRRDSFNTAQH